MKLKVLEYFSAGYTLLGYKTKYGITAEIMKDGYIVCCIMNDIVGEQKYSLKDTNGQVICIIDITTGEEMFKSSEINPLVAEVNFIKNFELLYKLKMITNKL
jgi:hypothetical protein